MEKIRIFIAHDATDMRGRIREWLSAEEDFQILGEAINGEEAVNKTRQLLPDVVIVSHGMAGIDGLVVTEKIAILSPKTAVIMTSPHYEPEYLKRAMIAGAREYILEPFEREEFLETVRRTAFALSLRQGRETDQEKVPVRECQVVTIFGAKGGVGKTTLSVNLAACLAKKYHCKVALIDLDLQFGDVSVFLNISPKKTISELVQEKSRIDIHLVESYLVPHSSQVKVLPAPLRPEFAELVNPDAVMDIIDSLKKSYDFVIIDTPPLFQETVLSALEMSRQILLVMCVDLPAIKNMRLCLELLHTLNQRDKARLVINRDAGNLGISDTDVEKSLDFMIAERIPNDYKLAITAVNRGMPFVLSDPAAKVSKAVERVATLVYEDGGTQGELGEGRKKKSVFGKLFR